MQSKFQGEVFESGGRHDGPVQRDGRMHGMHNLAFLQARTELQHLCERVQRGFLVMAVFRRIPAQAAEAGVIKGNAAEERRGAVHIDVFEVRRVNVTEGELLERKGRHGGYDAEIT